MRDQTEKCNIERAVKHLDLYRAIENINSICAALDHLLMKIQGPVPCEVSGEKESLCEPTLSELLSNGAVEIHRKIEEAHDIVNRIDNELF